MNSWLVRNLILPAHELISRRDTFRFYRHLKKSQWTPSDKLAELQLSKLRKLVAIALNNTSGYADLAGLEESFVPKTLDDLQLLPILDKDTIRTHLDSLVNRDVPGGPIRFATGGSTGEPLVFYLDRRRQGWDKAARMLTHEWFGVRPGDREIYLWGSPIEITGQGKIKAFRDRMINEMLLPAFDLTKDRAGEFISAIRRFKPKSIYGYPSIIAMLCRFAAETGERLDNIGIKAIF
ncbi:MAG TPA: phenylacetate--CoA ligase family protein, partial [Phycisphaerae bacterium]|nr:phenylacetate--CoA ligase family protein [Phycisphaerae bacterium]